jgi:nucleotide-binding universal stress UspA family protein
MEKIKVLIPTDFSVQAEYAYLLVNNLAKKADVEIHFVHVMNLPDTVTMDAFGSISTCGEIDVQYVKNQKDIADRKLSELKFHYGDNIQTHVIVGKVTDAVIQFAEQNQFDLIAMGTKGALGWKEKISGTSTQLVARKSNVPVLSLMCDRSQLEIKNILIVHQFSESKNQELNLLHKIIRLFEPTLHFLQIDKSSNEASKTQILEDMKMFATENGIEEYVPHIIHDSAVESGVIHFNQMNDMDLLCIGTHGKGGFFHASATEKLINHMFKPIISFHLN